MGSKNKAVFWDRDGVLVELVKFRADGLTNVSPQRLEDFKAINEAKDILNTVKLKGYLNLVVTNQPDVARGKMPLETLNIMHDLLKLQIPAIDAIYVCPHSDEDNCACRKPKPGLLLDAAKDFHLDLSQCFLVGDAQKDITAAKAAGVIPILLRTHYNMQVEGFRNEIKQIGDILTLLN